MYSRKENLLTNKYLQMNSSSENYFDYNLKLNKDTYLPDGHELLKYKNNMYMNKFKHDSESIIKIDDLIISTICYKNSSYSWTHAGNNGWKIYWIVINLHDRYFKLILNKNSLEEELLLKINNKKYFIKKELNEFMNLTNVIQSHSIFKSSLIINEESNIINYEKKYGIKINKFNDSIKYKRIMKLGSIHKHKIDQLKEIISDVISSKP